MRMGKEARRGETRLARPDLRRRRHPGARGHRGARAHGGRRSGLAGPVDRPCRRGLPDERRRDRPARRTACGGRGGSDPGPAPARGRAGCLPPPDVAAQRSRPADDGRRPAAPPGADPAPAGGAGIPAHPHRSGERETMAANVLALGDGALLALAANRRTNERLREAGFEVLTCEGGEISANGSGGRPASPGPSSGRRCERPRPPPRPGGSRGLDRVRPVRRAGGLRRGLHPQDGRGALRGDDGDGGPAGDRERPRGDRGDAMRAAITGACARIADGRTANILCLDTPPRSARCE